MKIMTGLLSLAALLLSSSQVMAQQVGTIGIGDVTYSAKNSSTVRSSQYVLNAFNNGISRKLANTRKFSVLGYSELTDRLKKQGRTLDGYYAKTYTGNVVKMPLACLSLILNWLAWPILLKASVRVYLHNTLLKFKYDNGMVTLNYGAGWLEAGDTIFVYPADAEVVIDKSGNSIGDAVATLKVFTSDRKFAVAQAVNGYEGLEKGQKGKLLLKRG